MVAQLQPGACIMVLSQQTSRRCEGDCHSPGQPWLGISAVLGSFCFLWLPGHARSLISFYFLAVLICCPLLMVPF